MSRPRTCVITGASAGIGAACARTFAAEGWNLVLTARRAAPMEALADELTQRHGTETLVVPLDLFAADAVDQLADQLAAAGISADGLVNNAGYGAGGSFLERPWERHADFLRLMLEAPLELTHRFAPGMVDRGFGRIINVASLAAFLPGVAENNLYNAVKSALVKFSESVHAELDGTGVHVTALCPGFTHTEFHDAAENFDRSELDRVPAAAWATAESVADAGYTACEQNQAVCVPGGVNKAARAVVGVLPAGLTRRLLR